MERREAVLPTFLSLALVFMAWGLYALSSAGILRRLPRLHTTLLVIGAIYALRGLQLVVDAAALLRGGAGPAAGVRAPCSTRCSRNIWNRWRDERSPRRAAYRAAGCRFRIASAQKSTLRTGMKAPNAANSARAGSFRISSRLRPASIQPVTMSRTLISIWR